MRRSTTPDLSTCQLACNACGAKDALLSFGATQALLLVCISGYMKPPPYHSAYPRDFGGHRVHRQLLLAAPQLP